MPTERDHHVSKDRTYRVVVIPQGDSGSTRSFKASVMTIVLACCGAVALVIGLTVAAIIYTPAGLLLPMSEEQLRQRYGAELFEVQQRLNRVSSEVLVLREYNNKLRKALGQQELPADSVFNFSDAISAAKELPDRSEAENVPSRTMTPEKKPAAIVRTAAEYRNESAFRPAFPIITPAVGYVSRKFESDRGHIGIDYSGKIGSLIVAAADGSVVFAGYTVDQGFTLILSHGGGYLTMYMHNQSLLRSVGEKVKRGEPIALLGNSGRVSYGPHLHFELWKDGKAENPNDYLIASEL
jgi:murein DD-endopeptidase MepM/ murein hydrolase activator NlpD